MAALTAALAVGTAAADDLLEDFLVLGADPHDFRPSSKAASSGSLFFVGGSTGMDPTDASKGDAAIVALDALDGSEVWRASEGAADVQESFAVVGVAGGRVCAAGTLVSGRLIVNPFNAPILLVACYRAQRGERLWVRRIELDPAQGVFLFEPQLHVSERAVILTLSTLSSRISGARDLVLRFDATDGTGR
jgi:outer membrane protein assembly factor BamB